MHDVHAHGAAIPALGFGTYRLRGAIATEMVTTAVELGYRHVDTAQIYENEAEVGDGLREGLRRTGLDRSSVFLTTKVWPDHYRRADFLPSVEASLARLGVDHVDLLLLHWPSTEVPLDEAVEGLNAAADRGYATHIGVSNFPTALLAAAVAGSGRPLVTDQVEYHARLTQHRLRAALADYGMALTAYSPLAQGSLLDDAEFGALAADAGLGVNELALAWLVGQPQVVAIPKTASPARAATNLAAADIVLDADLRARIDALGSPAGRRVRPSFAPEWDTD